MSINYLQHFKLTRQPFEKQIADDELWLPPSKENLVENMLQAVYARQWSFLTGDPGVGKTCVLRALRARLAGEEGYRLTYCHNTTLGRRDFYRQICTALNLSPKATAAAVFYEITTHVTELSREQVRPVLLIDEAHLLHQDVLDHLHILGNYGWDSSPLLTLILIGLPELEERLSLRRNRSLYSRISRRFRIGGLRPEDTGEYIRARLSNAGCTRELFSSDAIALIHEAAEGALRDLDRLADNALRHAALLNTKLVERDAVTCAIRDDRLAVA